MKIEMIALGFVLGCSAFPETAAEGETETLVVDGEQALVECIESIQRQYFPVCLPSLTERLFQPAGSFPFDYEGFSPEQRALFNGWIEEHGIVHYAIGLCEDYWTGEIIVVGNSGLEMFRIPRKNTYDPYDLQREFFDLGKKEVLSDEFAREIFLPSKISTVLDLVPLVFWDAHLQAEQELAAQQELLVAQEAATAVSEESGGVSVGISVVPTETAGELSDENLLFAMESTPPPPPDGGGDTNSPSGGGSSNLVVELAISGFVSDYIEIFSKDDLILSSDWTLEDDWVPSYGAETVYWTDPASSNKMQRFYFVADAADMDGDGRSDLYEAWNGTSSNVFNNVDEDSDGMHDWWEVKLFGGLGQTGTNDFDGDGLLNNEELIPGQPPVMITDPSLYSSDDDALGDAEMYASPPTDPWNPDTTPPVATISWPTNNTVVTF